MSHFRFLVLANPVEGREDAFNDWYTNVHLPDVMRIPGVVAAQRYRLTEDQRPGGVHPYRYLAIYECETDDVRSVIDAFTARSGTDLMRSSDAMDGNRLASFFELIVEIGRTPA